MYSFFTDYGYCRKAHQSATIQETLVSILLKKTNAWKLPVAGTFTGNQ